MTMSLLRRAMTYHEEFPALRSTHAWIDGQTASLAGRVVLIAGAERVPDSHPAERGRTVRYQGYTRDVLELAVELTGIAPSEGRWLFHWARTLADQRRAVDAIEDACAIPGRPYWAMGDTEHRYINTDGAIIVAQHRRTVFYREHGLWHTVTMHSYNAAWRFARLQARERHAYLYRTRPTHYTRSVPA